MPPKLTTAERFWSHVDRSGGPDACWPWTANRKPSGYGQFRLCGRTHRSHRVGYEIQVGPIPDGLVIDHLCRNRACQNAKHLEPVTIGENIRRGDTGKGSNPQAGKTHCPQGHPYSGDNLIIRTGKYRGRRCRACSIEQHAYRAIIAARLRREAREYAAEYAAQKASA